MEKCLLPLLLTSISLLAAPQGAPEVDGKAGQQFSESWLNERARQLARSSYAPFNGAVPEELLKLTFDEYRAIRFRPAASVWRAAKEPFELQFFHLGHLFREPVSVYLVEGGRADLVRYRSDLFDYGEKRFSQPLPDTLGFAGFRVHAPIERKDYFDEVMAFLGASYFRAVGRNNAYGVSARGLAINTAVASGEIFPQFREFYVERPAPGSRHMVVHALLDSPTTTGAYRFDVTPIAAQPDQAPRRRRARSPLPRAAPPEDGGDNTAIKVSATLYPRQGAERLGVAPLTSMFLHGESDRSRFDDCRPEVHDSDGLLIWFGNGERLWRPVRNPDRLGVSVFRTDSLKGFGLMQRDRHPDHYEDLEASYERRPSVWIEPAEGFARGSLYLIEIPSREETNDNVVVFFTPDEKLAPDAPVRFAYRLLWGKSPEPPIATAAAVATYTGSARQIGSREAQQPLPPTARRLIIDFAPVSAPTGADGVEAVVTTSSGEVKNVRVQEHPFIGGYRAVFDFVPAGAEPAEMRCFLRRNGLALTETWTYRLERPHEGEVK
ncbi:MAG: hypothetical protein A2V77_02370 [Anaeromyxobacter sp. RBG_16_69_14]|nr:MAG: hypothetical protein A2V77_02370 [Anaeromyxobacter sp. RBG_16_69_14]